MTTETIERAAMKLPPTKRLRLAEKLMDSVDDFATPEIAKAWQAELARRVEEVENGTDPGVPAAEVHAEARRRLREARRISPARHR
jgi:putative addiction module component (TIGR02574 family)